jgi:predicted metal-binding membrane protein
VIPQGSLATAARRDRAILLGALALVVGLAWWHLLRMGDATSTAAACHRAMAAPSGRSWSGGDLAAAAVMWGAMMVAMMLPVVTPWLVALVEAARGRNAPALHEAGAFLLGYGSVWLIYSLAAATGQLALQRWALLSQEWVATSPALAAVSLGAAGVYQWTPLRDSCMAHCRSPFGFFLTSWREGAWGAVGMGARHGLYCLGCCWALMALSFVFGVMNLAWMAGLTVFLLLEKVTAAGRWMSRAAGAALVGYALLVLLRAL